jgi:hypothetical protein
MHQDSIRNDEDKSKGQQTQPPETPPTRLVFGEKEEKGDSKED